MKFNEITNSIQLSGAELSISTGKIARQSKGSILVKHGSTTVLCTANVGRTIEDSYFLPLSVQYVEKFYAEGNIPGGYLKREGRPSESEVLISRLIDRTLRPAFAKGFNKDVQVICTVLSYDPEVGSSTAACIGAATACLAAGLPLELTVAGCNLYVNDQGEYVVGNPVEPTDCEVFISGSEDSVLMVEAAAEFADEVKMLEAISAAMENVSAICAMVNSFIADLEIKEVEFEVTEHKDVYENILNQFSDKILAAYTQVADKLERNAATAEVKKEVLALYAENEDLSDNLVSDILGKVEKEIVRNFMFNEGKRIDGRNFTQIRDIDIDNDLLADTAVHGASLFTRGETQALVTTTLGSSQDVQYLDSVTEKEVSRFMLHYNFPPFSVGEVSPLRTPGRREIGHGRLARKALGFVLPSEDDFPYTIRLVSEIMESNGSSSMATVCGATLSLLATGVPILKPVAGIAMGLVKNSDKSIVLTDIMGDEDHLGDMDFKVAGTRDGITALQMDMKIQGIDIEILKVALQQAKDARIELLDIMEKSIDGPRALGKSAPKNQIINIPVKKIVDVIGKGGSIIKGLTEKFQCKIDINDDGTVKVFANNDEMMEGVINEIKNLTEDLIVGNVYSGKVVKILEFGAIIGLPGNKSGLLHISEIKNERIETVDSVLALDQEVEVKILSADERGRLKLSMKKVAK